ncbi:MAG: aminoglycoside phosphotransferase family protein [Propionicimonas sp.]|uniref:phosphotransferase n=1 Tax=Propionicimonas sp. TaxID=1955623 RepID=UPI003D11B99C
MEAEQPLAGGNMGPVTRLGDEVRRVAGPWTPNVHRLLELYASAGIAGTPRPLGFTDDGRERLSFVAGVVPAYPMPAWVWSAEVLDDAARLLRRLHDASLPLAGVRDGWRAPVREPAEVVCHNDFAPYNLVFVHGRLAGVIDFDYATPGPRAWDLSYLAYRLVPLTGWTDPAEPPGEARRERLERLLATYGSPLSADDLLPVVVERLHALADFSDEASVRLANPELAEHARGYRDDAARITSGVL